MERNTTGVACLKYGSYSKCTYRVCADAGTHAGIHGGGRTLGDSLTGDKIAEDLVEQTGTEKETRYNGNVVTVRKGYSEK